MGLTGARPHAPSAAEREVAWHDLECGGYTEDLPLWRELAASRADGPVARVLELGAGTGRVSLDLARAGHEVTALEISPALLGALRERARGLPLRAVAGDARRFELGVRFDVCLVPMQTLQLLDGAGERGELLAAAGAHLRPGGLFACAIVTAPDSFDARSGPAPEPERMTRDGFLYESRPLAVRPGPRTIRIERERVVTDGAGAPAAPPEHDVVVLAQLTARQLWAEGGSAGLRPAPSAEIAETEEHSGSEVVMLDA